MVAPVLQVILQQRGEPGRHQAVLTLTDEGWAPRLVTVEFSLALSDQDPEDIRWYLEDYLELAEDPAPRIAARIEKRMEEIGETLFSALFETTDDARGLWWALRPRLGEARIEVVTSISTANALPWELLRDPRTGAYVALEACAFVRGPQPNALPIRAPARPRKAKKVRILLAVCRPKGGGDVPFRSVASLLAKGLTGGAPDSFDLDVLRPPTFDQLAKVLRLAKDQGAPYHAVHFDGHGTYADAAMLEADSVGVVGGLKLDTGKGPPRPVPGRRGFLLFEDPGRKNNTAFIDGTKLGGLLRETRVPVLILNACQSAFAEAPSQPVANESAARAEIDAYSSLAQLVLDAGAAGVVAMRYSVYVVTAAQFVAGLYSELAHGRTLGEAVSVARKHLAEKPERAVAFEPRCLQDWSVPVVWERQPLRLWPQAQAKGLEVVFRPGAGVSEGGPDRALPVQPELGFFGRDETLYALDRGFDANRIVLLWAYAGAGKTATAVEFARWYRATGGAAGPILFSTFERHLPLARLLDKIGAVFSGDLTRAGVEWDAINDLAGRRDVALQVLRQVPVLWIWDNVEPVAGFPSGAPSEWSDEEQRELADFLREATVEGMQAKFLLTSRREERRWLGELPTRVAMPPMPMRERLQLAHALAGRRGLRPAALPDLRPLLRFSGGNPLTILVTVGQALRDGIDTPERLDAYVAKLRAGAQELAGEAEEAEVRDRSLGASLSYGFSAAFSEEERRALSLLHLFQGSVDAAALCIMGDPKSGCCVKAVCGWTRDQMIALLDRAAEIGLLSNQGGGSYTIHPALPWFFRSLFECHHPGAEAERARCAFVAAIGALAEFFYDLYQKGQRVVLNNLLREEDNLRIACSHARAAGWWDDAIGVMQGLQVLFSETGRRSAWRELVDTIASELADSATDGPLPGREKHWHHVSGYQVRIAMEDLKWPEADRLLQQRITWLRHNVSATLLSPLEKWVSEQRLAVNSLGKSLTDLGDVRRAQGEASCIVAYQEAFDLFQKLNSRSQEATCALNIGMAYVEVTAARDLDRAEHWISKSLELRAPGDNVGQAISLGSLGLVALHRFDDAIAGGQPKGELLTHLTAAASRGERALSLLPDTSVYHRAITHNLLAGVYDRYSDVPRALSHCQQAIRCAEEGGDVHTSGQFRLNAAAMLRSAKRLRDAQAYAEAALANFRQLGVGALDLIRRTEALLVEIDAAIAKGDQS